MKKLSCLAAFALYAAAIPLSAQITAGNASYLDVFPGTDEAGRNSYPAGTPHVSGKAATRPVPTNDWWSNELINRHGASIFNYPLALKPLDNGMAIIKNIQGQAITAENPLTVGMAGLSSPVTSVSDYGDWTVTFRWADGNGTARMEATAGQGMPMVYFKRFDNSQVEINITSGSIAVNGNVAVVSGCYNRSNYAIYAPTGSQWTQSGNRLTSDLNGKNYWTVAMLPDDCTDASAKAAEWSRHAFAFPSDTRAVWDYDRSTGRVTTRYSIEVLALEPDADTALMGLLPHHWGHLSPSSARPSAGEFSTVRGALRMLPANEFTTELTFNGILPMLPAALNSGTGYSDAEMRRLVAEINDNTGFQDWTDSYNDGQLLNRLTQTAYAAHAAGDTEGFRRSLSLVKTQLERWFTASAGDRAFVFYYHKPWNAMLAYPAGHGQDSNLNDHNFHFGYFIGAAAMVARFDKEWAEAWGPMVDLLVRDVASTDRNDSMFPYLRSFSPFSGHCWANGFGTLGQGNDQESSSEAMMSHSAMILWAAATGNDALLDAAVWMYVTEMSAVEEYWFDVNHRVFPADYRSALASRVFTNGFDDENFWGGGIAGSYGIELYPVQPSSTYLVHNREFAAHLWDDMCRRTGILSDEDNPNIWYDTWIQFLAMQDCEAAIKLYNTTKHLGVKFGATQALTYYWIHTLANVGTPDFSVTSDYPLATVFTYEGMRTYAAANYGDAPLTVHFSDGYTMTVAPNSQTHESSGTIATSIRLSATGLNDGDEVRTGSEVTLSASVISGDRSVTSVEFFCNGNSIKRCNEAPWSCVWTPEAEGTYTLTAKVTDSDGNNATSSPLTIVAKNDAVTPGTPGAVCYTIDSKASEGAFNANYTIGMRTVDDATVRVSAEFDDEKSYIGFAGPWLFNETNGFEEIAMNRSDDGTYTADIHGLSTGQTAKIRVKIAFAGGLAVTAPIEYEVGHSCATSGINAPSAISDIRLAYHADDATLSIETQDLCTCSAAVYDIAGRRIGALVNFSGNTIISVDQFPEGIYILHVYTAGGTAVLRFIR